MSVTLRIIRASSREKLDLLRPRRAELEEAGFRVLYDELPEDPTWRYTAASVADRRDALATALAEPSDAVLCARGGYGASDLLPDLDWARLAPLPPKLVVGFSDASALHSACYAKLAWTGLHAPMPATVLWRRDGRGEDIDQLLALLKDFAAGAPVGATLPLTQLGGPTAPLTGTLFGGCISVLSGLIGTPFFPASLAGHCVFLEDTDENPGRLVRCLNQWLQAGVLQGVRAVIFGHLRGLGDNVPDSAPFVLAQLVKRLPGLPVFHTPLFGHTSPNLPLMIGAPAEIRAGRLTWRWQRRTPVA